MQALGFIKGELMTTLPLIFNHGHLFVELEDNFWLFDTGAPTSFGSSQSLTFSGEQFSLEQSYFGLTAEALSEFVGVQCRGLLGADILGRFDHIINIGKGLLKVSTAELPHDSLSIPLDDVMGIPVVTVRVGSKDYRMFFDTGAQISYFQDDSLADFNTAGSVSDFYPGFGQFQTDTHEVPVTLGTDSFILRCGSLPGVLGATLMMADTQGIIGNQVLIDRIAGFFPRRGMISL